MKSGPPLLRLPPAAAPAELAGKIATNKAL